MRTEKPEREGQTFKRYTLTFSKHIPTKRAPVTAITSLGLCQLLGTGWTPRVGRGAERGVGSRSAKATGQGCLPLRSPWEVNVARSPIPEGQREASKQGVKGNFLNKKVAKAIGREFRSLECLWRFYVHD